jgi:hypothetical protein
MDMLTPKQHAKLAQLIIVASQGDLEFSPQGHVRWKPSDTFSDTTQPDLVVPLRGADYVLAITPAGAELILSNLDTGLSQRMIVTLQAYSRQSNNAVISELTSWK